MKKESVIFMTKRDVVIIRTEFKKATRNKRERLKVMMGVSCVRYDIRAVDV